VATGHAVLTPSSVFAGDLDADVLRVSAGHLVHALDPVRARLGARALDRVDAGNPVGACNGIAIADHRSPAVIGVRLIREVESVERVCRVSFVDRVVAVEPVGRVG